MFNSAACTGTYWGLPLTNGGEDKENSTNTTGN